MTNILFASSLGKPNPGHIDKEIIALISDLTSLEMFILF